MYECIFAQRWDARKLPTTKAKTHIVHSFTVTRVSRCTRQLRCQTTSNELRVVQNFVLPTCTLYFSRLITFHLFSCLVICHNKNAIYEKVFYTRTVNFSQDIQLNLSCYVRKFKKFCIRHEVSLKEKKNFFYSFFLLSSCMYNTSIISTVHIDFINNLICNSNANMKSMLYTCLYTRICI